MAVWVVRAGRQGEREQLALENGMALIGWAEIQRDLSQVESRDELEQIMRGIYKTVRPNVIPNWVGQVWAFVTRIKVDDLVVVPLKGRSAVAVGKATGPYEYRPYVALDMPHTRPVKWLDKGIPRVAFDQDIRLSIGSDLTVCQVQRDRAMERILALVHHQPVTAKGVATPNGVDGAVDAFAPLDLEEYARDQIMSFLGEKFRSHDLARLVTALLKAQGYQVQMSPAGPDGGVDIIAGRGPIGFDPPRLCVQVKSSDQPLDVKPLRELRGVMKTFGADQGLLVSWGGFKQSVITEARPLFFELRLWDAGNIVDQLLEVYDRLSADVQAELPLKRVWTLVQEQAED